MKFIKCTLAILFGFISGAVIGSILISYFVENFEKEAKQI